MSQGIHTMDHLLDLLGHWEEVRAIADTLYHQIEVEDVSMALVKFANGARASIINSVLSPRQETYLRLDCEHATVELTHLYAYEAKNWKLTPAEPADAAPRCWRRGTPSRPTSAPPTAPSSPPCSTTSTPTPCRSPAAPRPAAPSSSSPPSTSPPTPARPVTRGSIQPGDPFYTAINGGLAPVRHKK